MTPVSVKQMLRLPKSSDDLQAACPGVEISESCTP